MMCIWTALCLASLLDPPLVLHCIGLHSHSRLQLIVRELHIVWILPNISHSWLTAALTAVCVDTAVDDGSHMNTSLSLSISLSGESSCFTCSTFLLSVQTDWEVKTCSHYQWHFINRLLLACPLECDSFTFSLTLIYFTFSLLRHFHYIQSGNDHNILWPITGRKVGAKTKYFFLLSLEIRRVKYGGAPW